MFIYEVNENRKGDESEDGNRNEDEKENGMKRKRINKSLSVLFIYLSDDSYQT